MLQERSPSKLRQTPLTQKNGKKRAHLDPTCTPACAEMPLAPPRPMSASASCIWLRLRLGANKHVVMGCTYLLTVDVVENGDRYTSVLWYCTYVPIVFSVPMYYLYSVCLFSNGCSWLTAWARRVCCSARSPWLSPGVTAGSTHTWSRNPLLPNLPMYSYVPRYLGTP